MPKIQESEKNKFINLKEVEKKKGWYTLDELMSKP